VFLTLVEVRKPLDAAVVESSSSKAEAKGRALKKKLDC
jgi:hypothetical protein